MEEVADEEVLRRAIEAVPVLGAAGEVDKQCQALTTAVHLYIASGQVDEAVRYAQEQRLRWKRAGNEQAELASLEAALQALWARKDFAAVMATANSYLEAFQQTKDLGGQGRMWYILGQANLAQKQHDAAIAAARQAVELFVQVSDHEAEALAEKLYHEAHTRKNSSTYAHIKQEDFYMAIRKGLGYGPRFRNNHEIHLATSGPAHVVCALDLTADAAEQWEHECGYHAGIIDAGGHSGFAIGWRPVVTGASSAQAQAEQQEGPNIPFMLDGGYFTRRANQDPMYMSIFNKNVYFFQGS